MGEKDDSKIGIMINNEFREIKPIPEFAIGGMIADTNIGLWGEHSAETVMSFKINKRFRKIMKALLGSEIPIQFTNNYRKRHGIPMRRKTRIK